MTAASPGVVALLFENLYYPSRELYLVAIAQAMQEEYEAIAAAGFVLQLDCPDLAMGRHTEFSEEPLEAFHRQAVLNVEVLNHATARIPADQIRLHLCWGNYEGPHHRDVALREVIDIVLRARPNGLSIEACNPRHGHEWRVFEVVQLPEEKVLIPGVIDTTTNFIEHPALIAQRLSQYASLVVHERVIAGTECGFATFADRTRVEPAIAWDKLAALVDGARLASSAFQGQG